MHKRFLGIGLGIFLGVSAHLLTHLYLYQEKLLFKHKPLKPTHSFSSQGHLEEIFLQTSSTTQLHAVLHKAPHPKGIFLYFHGRGGNLAISWNSVAEQFVTMGYDVLMMDYRGFGKSRGLLSEKALCEDGVAMYDYALQRYGQEPIIYGRSLGTGIATYVASVRPAKLLLLEAPYFCMRDLVAVKFPLLPKSLLSLVLKYPLRTDQWIKNVTAPIGIFHGTADELIPYQNSQQLYESAASSNPHTVFTLIEGGTHNDLTYHLEYKNSLKRLLEMVTAPSPKGEGF